MMLDAKVAVYLLNIAKKAREGDWGHIEAAPMVCPECGRDAQELQHESDHIIITQKPEGECNLFYVVIACQGYWCLDPNLFGINSPNWCPLG